MVIDASQVRSLICMRMSFYYRLGCWNLFTPELGGDGGAGQGLSLLYLYCIFVSSYRKWRISPCGADAEDFIMGLFMEQLLVLEDVYIH